MYRLFPCVLAATCALAFACGETVEVDATRARVCLLNLGDRSQNLHDETTTPALAAGAPLTVRVEFDGCVARELEARCDVRDAGQPRRLRVEASGEAELDWSPPGSASESICFTSTVFCDTPALDAGEWTLIYEPTGESLTVTVPQTPTRTEVPCL